jgi:hypothetical protein
MSATDESKGQLSSLRFELNATRREVLVALGLIGAAAPLFGCGGGGGGSPAAVNPPPTTTPPPPPPPPPPTLDLTPTVTFDATATSGLTTNFAYLTASSAVNPAFTFSGAAPSLITQLGPTAPRANMVSAVKSTADTFSPGTLYTTFYHTGTMLDIMQYGLADNVMLYINDTFSARYGIALVSGTAQGGGASSIALASTSSNANGYYNTYYVRISGGTGTLNEAKQITAYDGATFTATVDSAWTTPPDATTQYVIQEGPQPFVLDGLTGAVKYLHLRWNQSGQRKITIEQGIFAGVISDGSIAAAPTAATTPFMAFGDSFWEGNAAPTMVPNLIDIVAESMNWLPINLGAGGTGFISPAPSRLNFQDQIAPPAEAWRVLLTATGGTYTVSVTFGGATVTTAPLPYNTSQAALAAALAALSNVGSAGGSFNVARGDLSTPLIIVGHAVAGATLSVDGTGLTGGSISVLGAYMGDVAENVPTDSGGNALPFYLLVCGSGNDTSASDVNVQAAATYVAQQISARFPTAKPIFIGILGDCGANANLIGPTDISRNGALAAGAAHLPMINGKTPFIDTYAAGLNQPKLINGLGTVANPAPGTNSNFKSITFPGHATGPGIQFLADWLAPQLKTLIG